MLIDETENEETVADEVPAEEEVIEEVAENDILPEVIEGLTEAVETLADAISEDAPAEETKEGDTE